MKKINKNPPAYYELLKINLKHNNNNNENNKNNNNINNKN